MVKTRAQKQNEQQTMTTSDLEDAETIQWLEDKITELEEAAFQHETTKTRHDERIKNIENALQKT